MGWRTHRMAYRYWKFYTPAGREYARRNSRKYRKTNHREKLVVTWLVLGLFNPIAWIIAILYPPTALIWFMILVLLSLIPIQPAKTSKKQSKRK